MAFRASTPSDDTHQGKAAIDGTVMDDRHSRGGGLAGRGARLAAGVAVASSIVVAMAAPSQAVECPPDRPLCRLLSTPTTTTPAPAAASPSLTPSTVAPPPPPPAPAPLATSAPEAAQRLLDLVNGERARAGLSRLASRDDVVTIALTHSNRMAAAGDIFHNDSYFSDAVRKSLNTVARGENVAQNSNVNDTHIRLMNSPGHRANILDPRFSVAGFAVVRTADGRYFTTQNFLQPAGEAPLAAPQLRAGAGTPPAAVDVAAPADVATVAPAPEPDPVADSEPAMVATAPDPTPDRIRHLASRDAAPTAPTGGGARGRNSAAVAWLPPIIALALVALGTVQVGRQLGGRRPAPR